MGSSVVKMISLLGDTCYFSTFYTLEQVGVRKFGFCAIGSSSCTTFKHSQLSVLSGNTIFYQSESMFTEVICFSFSFHITSK